MTACASTPGRPRCPEHGYLLDQRGWCWFADHIPAQEKDGEEPVRAHPDQKPLFDE